MNSKSFSENKATPNYQKLQNIRFSKTKESNHNVYLTAVIFETWVFFKFTGLMHNFPLKLSKNIGYSRLDKGWTFRQCPDFIFDSHCFKNIFKLYPTIVSYHKSSISFPNTGTIVMITSCFSD